MVRRFVLGGLAVLGMAVFSLAVGCFLDYTWETIGWKITLGVLAVILFVVGGVVGASAFDRGG